MYSSTMLMASLIITAATILLTIVNLYIGRKLMAIYRLTKKEGQKVIHLNQITNQQLEVIESLEKRIKANASQVGLYDFWPSDN